MSANPLTVQIVRFLRSIGFNVRWGPIEDTTVLPGIAVRDGGLVIDDAKLAFPGDLLHEAGHLAVLPSRERTLVDRDFGPDAGREMAAMAWSWAALRHLELDPAVVFHQAGYRGGAAAFIENFTAGRYVGVPVLEWLGMTSADAFPAMSTWVLD